MSIVGVGYDLVELDRVQSVWERFDSRFLARCFTQAEVEFCLGHADPLPHLAARFAAKEAAAKALGTGIAGGIGWRDIEVVRQKGQRPEIHFHELAEQRFQQMGAHRVHLSLTHTRGMAAACVILESA